MWIDQPGQHSLIDHLEKIGIYEILSWSFLPLLSLVRKCLIPRRYNQKAMLGYILLVWPHGGNDIMELKKIGNI